MKTRVFVVEDQALFREGIVESLNREPDLSVCGEAEDAPTALVAINAIAPDLVLTDLHLKSASGLNLIRELRRRHPALPVVAMTLFDPATYERQALAVGASGFVDKQEGARQLVAVIRAALTWGAPPRE